MGATIEGTGALILPRKKSKKSKTRSKHAKKFDQHAALATLIQIAGLDVGNQAAIDIANGDGIAIELPVASDDDEQRRQLVKRINAASKRIDAVIHVVETDEPRPRVLVAVLPPDVKISEPGFRMMLREEMVDAIGAKRAVQAAQDRERDIKALAAYDELRGRVADIEALAYAANAIVLPWASDVEKRRDLARLGFFIPAIAELALKIVDESAKTAAELMAGSAARPIRGPSPRFSIDAELSAIEERARAAMKRRQGRTGRASNKRKQKRNAR